LKTGNNSISVRKYKFFTVPAEEIRNNEYDLSISRYKEMCCRCGSEQVRKFADAAGCRWFNDKSFSVWFDNPFVCSI
jgi:hypothetical protein